MQTIPDEHADTIAAIRSLASPNGLRSGRVCVMNETNGPRPARAKALKESQTGNWAYDLLQ
jgi:hypothetical protein